MSGRLPIALLLGAGIALGGWYRSALTLGGAVAASAVGTLTYGFGGLRAGAALVAFFVSGSWLSRRGRVRGEVVAAKGHRRDPAQVLANGGVAAAAATAAHFGFLHGHGGVVGALAAAAADTWASEIGVRSRTPPRLVTTGRVVPPGTSGGVTRLGWLAAAGGALSVGAVYALAGQDRSHWPGTTLAALAGGLLGSLADSVAGATVQAAYRCDVCGRPSESPLHACAAAASGTASASLVRGHMWVTNDVVILLATAVGGLVGAAACRREACATLGSR